MKNNADKEAMKRNLFTFLILASVFSALGFSENNEETPLTSRSSVNWINRSFNSSISLDVDKSGIPMPSGKASAQNKINSHLVTLIKDPLLTISVDSSHMLGDYILNEDITLRNITDIIDTSSRTLGSFKNNSSTLNVKHSIEMNEIGSLFVKHHSPYTKKKSIDTISSRPYTGIIIDARGSLPVHGEFIESEAYPCIFPRIWNEEMEVVYERSMMKSSEAKSDGIIRYDYSDEESRYQNRSGVDPLRIKAKKVFGENRTDIIISDDDALRIFSVPENEQLLRDGKVVLLLDKENLMYDVAAPVKDESYYTVLKKLKEYPLRNISADSIEDGPDGPRFSYNLKFVPDSPELLPGELQRITELAELLKGFVENDEYTIYVAGHTADIGQHENQMHLSIERTQTIIKLLISEGLSSRLFTYRGFGETQPVASNDTPEGMAQNRRVVITLRPRTTYIQRAW